MPCGARQATVSTPGSSTSRCPGWMGWKPWPPCGKGMETGRTRPHLPLPLRQTSLPKMWEAISQPGSTGTFPNRSAAPNWRRLFTPSTPMRKRPANPPSQMQSRHEGHAQGSDAGRPKPDNRCARWAPRQEADRQSADDLHGRPERPGRIAGRHPGQQLLPGGTQEADRNNDGPMPNAGHQPRRSHRQSCMTDATAIHLQEAVCAGGGGIDSRRSRTAATAIIASTETGKTAALAPARTIRGCHFWHRVSPWPSPGSLSRGQNGGPSCPSSPA